MPAWLTLKDGRVLKYNRCGFVEHGEKEFVLRQEEDAPCLAIIPTCNIQRFEFERPCKIYREKRKDKLPFVD